MKYTKYYNETFGWNDITYDTNTLTKTRNSGCGDYSNTRIEEMTKEEMQKEINNELLFLYSSMNMEIKHIQEKYEKNIQNVKKMLENLK
jgi:uncharacterized protein YsxB (DUF464 family)